MDVHAREPVPPLEGEATMQPLALLRARSLPGLRIRDIHVLTVPIHEGVAEALGNIGRSVRAEAEAPLRHEDEPIGPFGWLPTGQREVAGLCQEDRPHLVELGRGHGQLVEVVLGVVLKPVGRLPEKVPRSIED